MKIILATVVGLLGSFAVAAQAQTAQPPSSIQDVQRDWQPVAAARISLNAALDNAAKSLAALLQEKQGEDAKLESANAIAAYWQDACQSTPQCGGAK